MDKLQIIGGIPLHGQIEISGAKNAILPLLAAALLTKEKVTLTNVSHLADVATMIKLISAMGCTVSMEGGNSDGAQGKQFSISTPDTLSTLAPYEMVNKMRASVLVLGPLLTRFGHAEISLPGGCAIGTRPIDLHLKALKALGASIDIENGYVKATAPQGLKGAEFTFPIVSVTGTGNLLMAAALAEGTTRIINAALEPEITDLGNLLNAMGARITGHGTNTITIDGVTSLNGTTYRAMPDRIEAGTYAMAAAITKGSIEIINADFDHLPATVQAMKQAGVVFTPTEKGIRVVGPETILPVDISTQPYPGFATDLQAQFLALMCVAKGRSVIEEKIFENRFMHVAELKRLGAEIRLSNDQAIVTGVDHLTGADVMATDLRASVALVLAGLAAQGTTTIHRIYHLDRGYENIEQKLSQCGAQIKRIA
ncbi:MAG: UDP-N-acetylglucosamine 1-carboxyvinyltransferase [Alphaproteobacteria bacterium]|nr:MAG: UDP-N-acetylglucosamine 1-carboxyvinyltransferase [Alphaproteobacteria bacterium]